MLQLKGMFRMADLDGSGSIDFNEFLHVCAELSPCLCSDLACLAPPSPPPLPTLAFAAPGATPCSPILGRGEVSGAHIPCVGHRLRGTARRVIFFL